MNIHILSGPIRSGKTTVLREWLKKQESIGGLLMPDIDEKRHIFDIASQEIKRLEVDNGTVNIGRFSFDLSVFDWANTQIINASKNHLDWLIIDEIGPLEIRRNEGFHKALLDILNDSNAKNLLIVVREFLLDEFVANYHLTDFEIFDLNDLKSNREKPIGIVLCGGKSSRMGMDKAFFEYHGMPQYLWVASILKPFCKSVYFSINKQQEAFFKENHPNDYIVDAATIDEGPLNGFLSAKNHFPNEALFFAGCDFPNLTIEMLFKLYSERQNMVVCFESEGLTQPLISLWNPDGLEKLIERFEKGENSVKRIIDQLPSKKIETTANAVMNVNTTVDYEKWQRTSTNQK